MGVKLNFDGMLSSGSQSLTWTGANDSGIPVSGGIYYIHVESVDQFGTVSSYNLAVNVVEPVGENKISIFNSAGELVYYQSFHSLTSTVTDLLMQDNSFVPLFDAAGISLSQAKGQIRSNDGLVAPWSWDGKNSQGHVVAPGIYTIVLASTVAGGPVTKVFRKIQVLAAPDAFDAAPLLYYSSSGELLLRFNAAATAGPVHARLYNLAAELVGEGEEGPSKGSLRIDARHLAGGIYLLVFDYSTPSALRKRAVLKAGIVR